MTAKLVEMEANGRLVIPRSLRDELGVHGREQFSVEVRDGSVVLTPVAVVPVDRSFPITPDLVAAADRAAHEPAPGLSRAELHRRISRLPGTAS